MTVLKTPTLYTFNRYFVLDGKEPVQHYSPTLVPESCTQRSVLEGLASSVWCFNRIDGSTLCHFQNLYLSSKYEGCVIFLLNRFSTISGIESADKLKSFHLSSVKNHTGLNLKINIEMSCHSLLQENFHVLEKYAILMKRFKPDNLMHVIHDDVFPLFTTYDELCHGDIQRCLSTYQLIFLDDNDEGPYHEWYEHMSAVSPMFKRDIRSLYLKNCIIGISHSSSWYQYGFKSVHGPIDNTQLNGLQLRKFTKFIKDKFDIQDANENLSNKVVFLSRKINRKILNEASVEENIKNAFKEVKKKPIKVLNTDLTDNLRELISYIQETNLLIGMHGSAMILAIFLLQGSSILELFPFGIQPDYVSPTKALSSLPDVNYNYKAWVNKDENNTKTHPEYPKLLGGISHLPLSEQEDISKTKLVPAVECCHNPLYLFRMFQDTIVDDSFNTILLDLINEENNLSNKDLQSQSFDYVYKTWYFPAPVFNISCNCVHNRLYLSWGYPFLPLENVKFSLATSLGIAAIVDHLEFKSDIVCFSGNSLQDNPQKREVSLWVKAFKENKESEDTYFLCKFYS